MKTEIKINDENLSRYNKRFQKVVSAYLGKEVKLNEAANLLAQVLGAESTFELNKILTKDIVEEFEQKVKDPKLSSLDKIIIVTTQIQKMLLNTRAEFWYSIFTGDYAGNSPAYGTPEFNGVEVFSDYIGFVPFDYDPSPVDNFWDSIEGELEGFCIQWGQVKEDIGTFSDITYKEEDKADKDPYIAKRAKTYFIKKEVYASKKEVKLLSELAEFTQQLLWQIVNETKSTKDYWLVERDKITIRWGRKTKVINRLEERAQETTKKPKVKV